MPYDYHRGVEAAGYGLARTATLIDRARAEAGNSVLFDNGDFLQGSVLGDLATGPDSGWIGPHPVIAAMNRLGYDAACLGNHEFNLGLDWLTRALRDARFPVLCANAMLCGEHTPVTLRPASALLPVQCRDNTGAVHALRLGVLGLLPPQITTWDRVHLHGRLTARGIVESALDEVPRLRAAGADVVIALAHTGIGLPFATPEEVERWRENAALALATVPGLDAVLAGHSHEVFPDETDTAPPPGVDHAAGTLAGVPAVMAGYRGSHLGVLDLCLSKTGDNWSVSASHSVARPVLPPGGAAPVPPHPDVTEVARPAHLATLRLTSRPLGHTARPLHSYLSKVRPCDTIKPVLAAKTAALKAALAGTPHADLPLLAATTCYKSGGHAGPDDYIDIPTGPLTLGSLAELYPFPNTLIGLRLTGAQVTDWLERAASCFHQILPGMGDTPQPLWNPDFAGHAFDTISELTYTIDLSQPPRYDAYGALLNPNAQRIRDLQHHGAPVQAKAEFCFATNNFRAFGGGPYPKARPEQIIYEGQKPVRDHLLAHLRKNGPIGGAPWRTGWQLDGPRDALLLLETGPGLYGHPSELAKLSPRDLGTDARGFVRLVVPLAVLTDLANPVQTS